jgi:hypothetical protein
LSDKPLPFPSTEPAAARSEQDQGPLANVRNCPKCGKPTEIVANDMGVAAFCGPCNKWWPIAASGTALPEMPRTPGRGISKHTYLDTTLDESWRDSPPPDSDEGFLARRRNEEGDKISRGPQSASSYSQRLEERRKEMEAVKSHSKPLGGAPPIEPGKLNRLIEDPSMLPENKEPPRPSIPGVGAAYQVNQDMVQRKGPIPGVPLAEAMNMRPATQQAPGTGMSKESIEALKMVKDDSDKKVTSELRNDLDDADKAIADNAKKEAPFDLESLLSAKHPLLSEERRKAIEARLSPLDISDLIMKLEIVQKVPIIENKFIIELRTFSQREHIWILQYLYEFPGSDRYVDEMFNTLKLVCSLVSLNGRVLPDHRVNPGTREEKLDKKAFEEKMFHITSLPVQILADVGVQCNWFNDRVQKLFTVENLKNG